MTAWHFVAIARRFNRSSVWLCISRVFGEFLFRWQQLHCDDMARLFIVCLCSLHTFVSVWILTAVAEWLLMLLLRIVFSVFVVVLAFLFLLIYHVLKPEMVLRDSKYIAERNANTWNEHTHTWNAMSFAMQTFILFTRRGIVESAPVQQLVSSGPT